MIKIAGLTNEEREELFLNIVVPMSRTKKRGKRV